MNSNDHKLLNSKCKGLTSAKSYYCAVLQLIFLVDLFDIKYQLKIYMVICHPCYVKGHSMKEGATINAH